jgi:hypothetical protein
MKTKIVSALLIFVTISSVAQVRADGKWRHPENMKNICVDIEQNIVAMSKQIIDRNSAMYKGEVKSDQANYMEMTEASEKYLAKIEARWERLGCVNVLYAPKK